MVQLRNPLLCYDSHATKIIKRKKEKEITVLTVSVAVECRLTSVKQVCILHDMHIAAADGCMTSTMAAADAIYTRCYTPPGVLALTRCLR